MKTSFAVSTTPTSGTTVAPTSVQTIGICRKDMAHVGGVYVSSVTYSGTLRRSTNIADLTRTNSDGISFDKIPGSDGVLDTENNPLYTITIKFNSAGVHSLSNIMVNRDSNVDKFLVEFYVPSNPDDIYTSESNIPLSYSSTLTDTQEPIVKFTTNVPSPLSGIHISILSTNDNQ